MKETDIWTNVDVTLHHCSKAPCANVSLYGRHPAVAQHGASRHGQPGMPLDTLYEVPIALIRQLMRASVPLL